MEKAQQRSQPSAESQSPRADRPSATPLVPAEIAELLGAAPVIRGEDPRVYENLFNAIVAEIDPHDFVEWLWVKDFADNVWESRRLQRMLNGLIDIGMSRTGRRLLLPLMRVAESAESKDLSAAGDEAERIVIDHFGGDAAATDKLNTFLARGGLNADAPAAMSLAANLATVETIDRMRANLERRRDQILLGIERWRAGRAARLREISDAVIDDVAEPGLKD